MLVEGFHLRGKRLLKELLELHGIASLVLYPILCKRLADCSGGLKEQFLHFSVSHIENSSIVGGRCFRAKGRICA